MAAEQYRAALPGWMRLSCCTANKPPLPFLNLLALGGISCRELYRLLLRASCTQIHELLLFIDIPCRKSAPSCAPLLERSCKPWVRPGIKLRQRWFLQPGVSSLLGKWLHQGVPPCLPPCQHSPALLHCPQLPALPQTSPKGQGTASRAKPPWSLKSQGGPQPGEPPCQPATSPSPEEHPMLSIILWLDC